MPTKAEHRAKAEQNEFFVSTLENPFWDWAITGTFYAALHYVEAYLATKNPAVHSSGHIVRDSHIQKDKVLATIYNDYRELKNECHDARYEAHLTFAQLDVQRLQKHFMNVKKKLLPLI